MIPLAKRRAFLDRQDFIKRLQQIGEANRAAAMEVNLRHEAAKLAHDTPPLARSESGVSADARASLREGEARVARDIASRLQGHLAPVRLAPMPKPAKQKPPAKPRPAPKAPKPKPQARAAPTKRAKGPLGKWDAPNLHLTVGKRT